MRPIYLIAFILFAFSSCESIENRLVGDVANTNEEPVANFPTHEQNNVSPGICADNFYVSNAEILSSCIYSDSSTKRDWVPITSKEGNFRIKFPYTPTQENDKRYVDDFEVKTTIYNLDIPKSGLADNNLVYAISYTKDIKMSYYHTFEGYVRAQISGNIKDVHAQLKSDKKLKLRKGAEGREQLYILKGMDIEIKYRIIEFKNIIYTMSVATDKNHYNNSDISDFLNSFEFINS